MHDDRQPATVRLLGANPRQYENRCATVKVDGDGTVTDVSG